MNSKDLIAQTQRLIQKVNQHNIAGTFPEACEFLRVFAGENSEFYKSLKTKAGAGYDDKARVTHQILQSFQEYVAAGLLEEVSPERRAQLDVVSDFLEMANRLLTTSGVHPAAAAVLIGAALEEFLRTWTETESLSLENRKPGLETYSQVLRDANLITKQDGKDITSWGGIRNHAAHGEWQEVSDKARVGIMLDGVNLFMRKYS